MDLDVLFFTEFNKQFNKISVTMISYFLIFPALSSQATQDPCSPNTVVTPFSVECSLSCRYHSQTTVAYTGCLNGVSSLSGVDMIVPVPGGFRAGCALHIEAGAGWGCV